MRALENHVFLLRSWQVTLSESVGNFMYRLRFASKSRLVNFEICSRDDSGVRRHLLAFMQNNNITRRYFVVGDNELFAFAEHGRFRLHEFLERPKRILRFAFLDRPNNGVEEKHGKND